MTIEDVSFVDVEEVSIEKINNDTFRVAASGHAQGDGWAVNLHPSIFIRAPAIWVVEAVGLKPRGTGGNSNTPWKAATQLQLLTQTRKIAVKGRKGTISKPVPW